MKLIDMTQLELKKASYILHAIEDMYATELYRNVNLDIAYIQVDSKTFTLLERFMIEYYNIPPSGGTFITEAAMRMVSNIATTLWKERDIQSRTVIITYAALTMEGWKYLENNPGYVIYQYPPYKPETIPNRLYFLEDE